MPKKTIKKVKANAYAVIDELAPVKHPCVYFTSLNRTISQRWIDENATWADGCKMPNIKVVPCTITFTLPTPKKKIKRTN